MIVPMKKLTLFLKESNRQEALRALRSLGAMHLKSIKQQSSQLGQAAEFDDITAKLEQAQRAVTILQQYQKMVDKRKTTTIITDTQSTVEEVLVLYERLKSDEQELEKVSRHIDWYKPWGGFNPDDVKALSSQGVHVRLYQINDREYQQVKDRDDLRVISTEKGYVYIAHIAYKTDEKLSFKDVPLLEGSFDALCEQHTMRKNQIAEAQAGLQAKAYALKKIQSYKATLEKRQQFLKAMHDMGEEKGFYYIQGYIPEDRHDDIIMLAQANHAGYLLEDPDDIEDVPTLIQNPKWVEIINPVFKFMSTVPGYAEYDISAWFLLFLSLFFAMLVGDAGYGIVFLLATFIIQKRFKQLPRQPLFLMYVLSTATVAWGAITGTWFGAEAIAKLPFLNSLIIPNISSFAKDNQNLMIFICFTIGIIHLTLAHVIVGLRILNSIKVLAELGWILVLWALYFLAGLLVIGRPMPGYALGLLLAGAVLLLCFSEPQKNIFKAIASSLVNIPLKVVSSFADIVSYLRLFAVGCATVVLASTFNDIVMGIGFNSIISGLAAAIILFIGHMLNIALAFMAVIVHGIRLNMLEFSGQMGMSWSGKEYSPFKE
jgi:V/A-type H+/Na+-transporting ATPase subunit I